MIVGAMAVDLPGHGRRLPHVSDVVQRPNGSSGREAAISRR
jgi:hypothetical protein